MYTKFYGLKCKPFDLLPNPRFLYLSSKHDTAYAHLEYGFTANKPFIVLTGDVGTGKTTLINLFLKKADSDVKTALVYNTNLNPHAFLEWIVRDFGIQTTDTSQPILYESLYEFLLREHVQGGRCVLIIDEAQNMPNETLEEVRMLSNFETEESYLLQIIMAGQPHLKKRLNDPELAQLNQRVSVYYHLAPLEKSEIGSYIEHRLKVGGYNSKYRLFSKEAVEKIYSYTQGVPRLINSICDSALVYGYSGSLKTIDANLIEEVIEDRKIDPGIQDESVIGDEKAYTNRAGEIDTPVKQISKLNDRITRIEHKLSQLENIKNKQNDTFSEIGEWLKKVQEENRQLMKRYNDLLTKYKMMNASKDEKPSKTKSKITSKAPNPDKPEPKG